MEAYFFYYQEGSFCFFMAEKLSAKEKAYRQDCLNIKKFVDKFYEKKDSKELEQPLTDMVDFIGAVEYANNQEHYFDFPNKFWYQALEYVKEVARVMHTKTRKNVYGKQYDKALCIEARYLVGAFFEYIECDEYDPDKRFYLPRKRVLRPIIQAYQDVYDGRLDFLSVSQPKRTGKTSCGLRLALMMAGRKPDGSIFASGKGDGLVKSFYRGIDEMLSEPTTYARFLEVFPRAKLVNQNADEYTFHLEKQKRFASITCRPIDGSIVGNTEANNLLYMDDMVKNHEEARNRERLEFLCEKVTDDVLGRRIEGTPVIIQGTKYSLYDPISYLQEKASELGWRWKEVAIPALDPVTDTSNWEIMKDGKKIFTTGYYRKERELVTEETWAAEFQQEPFEAKGRMFPKQSLNRYIKLPIDKEPDTVIAACDSADSGEDSCSMPVAYVYGNEVYIQDVVFDNSGAEHTKPKCANMLVKHNVKSVTFESNSAGKYFGEDVIKQVDSLGGRCSARFKYNTTNKITRMENALDNILKYYYFLDESCYHKGSDYDKFIRELTQITRTQRRGRKQHDDSGDSLALLENSMRTQPASTQAIAIPW